MAEAARLFLFVFGLLTVAGGVMGFVKAKSTPSLVAGGVAGLLLLAAGYLMGTASARSGVVLGLVVSTLLALRFGMGFKKSKKLMPAGLMAALGAMGVVLTALTLARG